MKHSSYLLLSFLFCLLIQNLIGKYLLVQIQEEPPQDEDYFFAPETNDAKNMHPRAWTTGARDNEPSQGFGQRQLRNGFRSIQGKEACKDKVETQKCENRKAKGKCNKKWNQKNCQLTCGHCDDSEPTAMSNTNSCEVPLDVIGRQPCIGYECPPTCDTTVQKLCLGKYHMNANGQLCPKSDHCIDRMVDNNGNRCPGHCLPDCREGQRIQHQNGVDATGCPLPATCG